MRATTAYWAVERSSSKSKTGPFPKPASARTRNSRMAEGLERKQQANNFSLPAQLPSSPRRNSDIPEEGGICFYTKQWVIGPLAAITRIVANFSAFLMTEGCHHCAVQIEKETRAMFWQVDEPLQQTIVGTV